MRALATMAGALGVAFVLGAGCVTPAGQRIPGVARNAEATTEVFLACENIAVLPSEVRESGLIFVDDGEGLGVMEGAGTVGLEVARALPALDFFLVPMGSGSLAGGCGTAVKALHPRARVIAVQTEGSPAMVESFRARRPVPRPIDTIADGLVCREPAALALAALLEVVDDALLTDDATLLAAVHALAIRAHVLVEPSGAAALAGAWSIRDQLRGRTVVLVLTGSNITHELLAAALGNPGSGPAAPRT